MVTGVQGIDSLRRELLALFEKAKLPSSPAIASQILELINDPESTAAQFAEVIELDPALAANLLRMSNSVHYAQRNAVTTVHRAVTVIGLRRQGGRSTAVIRAPTTPRMPRRIVSTSGSSGMAS